MKLCPPSHFHDVRSLSWIGFSARTKINGDRERKIWRRTIPTVISHSRQQCCIVHQNGTPLRNPKNNGGPTGKSAPPMLLTEKMTKNTTTIPTKIRSLISHPVIALRFPVPSRQWRIPTPNQLRKFTGQCQRGEIRALIKQPAKIVKKSLTSSSRHPITVNPGAAARNTLVNILRGSLVREVSKLPEEVDLLVYP